MLVHRKGDHLRRNHVRVMCRPPDPLTNLKSGISRRRWNTSYFVVRLYTDGPGHECTSSSRGPFVNTSESKRRWYSLGTGRFDSFDSNLLSCRRTSSLTKTCGRRDVPGKGVLFHSRKLCPRPTSSVELSRLRYVVYTLYIHESVGVCLR